jgi:UDP-N-acetylglucosamine--N-acetylmuramyl-(pentapeptide) pyrophosphoryl-undecaprenol N-acetylglucosamine transferase
MVLESNAIPGRVVRLLAPLADCVQLQWREAAAHLNARRTIVTGNPVRSALFDASPAAARRQLGLAEDRLTLLVMGGSQGALPINRLVDSALRHLAENATSGLNRLQILHLTGPDHLRAACRTPVTEELIYRPVGFMDRIELAYAAADVVLGRAGGSSLAEVTALGLPSLLVPYPHAADGHQAANARILARSGAAAVLRQNQLTAARLADIIRDLADRPSWLRSMGEHARTLGRPDAAQRVAFELARMGGLELNEKKPHTYQPSFQHERLTSLSKAA